MNTYSQKVLVGNWEEDRAYYSEEKGVQEYEEFVRRLEKVEGLNVGERREEREVEEGSMICVRHVESKKYVAMNPAADLKTFNQTTTYYTAPASAIEELNSRCVLRLCKLTSSECREGEVGIYYQDAQGIRYFLGTPSLYLPGLNSDTVSFTAADKVPRWCVWKLVSDSLSLEEAIAALDSSATVRTQTSYTLVNQATNKPLAINHSQIVTEFGLESPLVCAKAVNNAKKSEIRAEFEGKLTFLTPKYYDSSQYFEIVLLENLS